MMIRWQLRRLESHVVRDATVATIRSKRLDPTVTILFRLNKDTLQYKYCHQPAENIQRPLNISAGGKFSPVVPKMHDQ